MSRIEREEFMNAAQKQHPQAETGGVMTGTAATQWMAAQGG